MLGSVKEKLLFLKNNETIRTGAFFSFSSILMSVANMVAGILVIKWITPEDIGIWNSIYVALYYISFLQLGVFNALNREMPFYLGKGRENFAVSLLSTAQWHAGFLSLLIIIVTIIFTSLSYFYNWFEESVLFSFANLGFVISLQLAINYLTVTFRASKSFIVLSFINFIQAIIIIGSLFLVYKFNYYGYVIRFVLISLSLFLMMFFYRPYKVKSHFSISNYKLLLKTGIPLFSLVFILGISDTFNRLVLLDVADYKAVGMYYPAIAVLVAMKILPGALSQFLYPKMSFEVGKSRDLKKIWDWVRKSLISILLAMIPIALVGYFLIPIAFEMFFPKYVSSIFASRIALISGVLSGSFIIITVFTSLKAWKELAFLAFLKASLYLSLQYYFALNYNPVNGVAIGTLLADIIFFIVLVPLTYYVLIKKK